MRRLILLPLLAAFSGLLLINNVNDRNIVVNGEETNENQNVVYSKDAVFKKITSIDELAYGDNIAITLVDKSIGFSSYNFVHSTKTQANKPIDVNKYGDYLYTQNTQDLFLDVIKLEKNDNNDYPFKFKSTIDDKYYIAFNDIGLDKGSTKHTTYSLNWVIKASSDNSFIISSKAGSSLRYLRYNSDNKIFYCYVSSTNLSIYKQIANNKFVVSDDLANFCKSSIQTLSQECNMKSVNQYTWNDISTNFSLLSLTDNDKAALISGLGVGYDKDPNATYIQDFLAKYDLITSLYNYPKFISYRNVNELESNNSLISKLINSDNDSNNLAIIIISASAVIIIIIAS